MKLKKILKDIDYQSLKGSKEIEITGISSDSRLAAPGNLFIARKGLFSDGSQFIYDAVSAGAIAVVTDMYDPFLKNITQIIHPDVASIEADIAANYYQNPSEDLLVVGITGTNGKTTTSYLIKTLLDHFAYKSGLIGGVENLIGSSSLPSTHTTPDTITCQKLFREMLNHQCKGVVMEVTSHGLAQNRVKNIEFDLAIFTNLTSDHLDYHKTWEHYAQQKAKLFTSLKPGKKQREKIAIINRDDRYADELIEKTSAKTLTYGVENDADVRAVDIEYSIEKTDFTIIYNEKAYAVRSPLVGLFNVYNLLAAFTSGIALSFSIEEMIALYKDFKGVPGRLERVDVKRDFHVFIDFAHTEDGLEKVLSSLKKIHNKRIITVFGCGGDRDATKRSKMGSVCDRYADLSIITNDNPRKEDPEKIAQEISIGFASPERYRVILDRKHAIEAAFQLAQTKDLVLIAGKGHEQYQVLSSSTVPFNDKEIALSVT